MTESHLWPGCENNTNVPFTTPSVRFRFGQRQDSGVCHHPSHPVRTAAHLLPVCQAANPNGFGDVDRPVQIRVDRVSALLAPEADSVSVCLFPMTTLAGLAGVFGVHPLHPNARHPCLVADYISFS
jgi:hypothetical protein